MARLSNCSLYDRTCAVVRPTSVFRVLFFVTVLCVLALGQIHLGFLRRDLMIETRKLQHRYTELLEHRSALTAEVEGKRQIAFEQLNSNNPLGLKICPPERRFRGLVTASVLKRWETTPSDTVIPGQEDDISARNVLFALGERVMSSPSFARTPEDQGL